MAASPDDGDTTLSPFDRQLRIQLQDVGADSATAIVDVDAAVHLQPWGAVHGGLYCTLVETLGTAGATFTAVSAGKVPVGLDNHTSFVRMASAGRITARARPIHKGSHSHLWEVRITDEAGRLLAIGTCRLALLDPR